MSYQGTHHYYSVPNLSMYIVQYTMYSVQCTLYNVQFTRLYTKVSDGKNGEIWTKTYPGLVFLFLINFV